MAPRLYLQPGIVLPKRPTADRTWRRRCRVSTPERSARSVLCIGSNAVHLNLRCSLLREHGWNVFSSGSGYEGLVRLGTQAIDLVILDLDNGDVEGR